MCLLNILCSKDMVLVLHWPSDRAALRKIVIQNSPIAFCMDIPLSCSRLFTQAVGKTQSVF